MDDWKVERLVALMVDLMDVQKAGYLGPTWDTL